MGKVRIAHDPFVYDSLPEELTADIPRWYLWRYELVPDREGPQKVPYQCLNPLRASSTNERHWSRFRFALATFERKRYEYDGLGRVFVPSDGIVGMDLDHVWVSDSSNELKPWAAQILARFADTYVEVSPSGNGYKLWCLGTLPEHRGLKWELGDGSKVEMYDSGRYFTVTGWGTAARCLTLHQRELDILIRSMNHHLAPHSQPRRDVNTPIPVGERHKSLTRLAGCMVRGGADAEAIRFALLRLNRRCTVPYSDAHVEQIVDSTKGWK